MGEKETGDPAVERSRSGNTVALDDDKGTVRKAAEKKDEEERIDEAGESGGALKTRHDTVKNSIGNIR
jgi:hypothetical protein